MTIKCNRAIAAAAAAAIALTSVSFTPAAAAPVSKPAQATAQAGDLEVSAQRRYRGGYGGGYRHHRGGDRAAVGAMLGVFGAIAGIAAANSYRRDRYDDYPYRYRYAPPAYGYRGGGPYYRY